MKFLHFDLRALALMRICIAIVIILDLFVRIRDLEMFYANTGVAPLPMIFEHGWNDYYLSIHVISGLWQVQLVLFIFSWFFAFMLLIGYRTTLFTVLSWFMLMSLHNRNGFILQGGDDLLRMVLFWSIFLPWGARYSVDAMLDTRPALPQTMISVAAIAYILQITYIYTGSALLKGPEWHTHFTAMYYVYGIDQIAYPFMKHLFYYPELLKKLTFIAYYFELLVPLLFFMPLFHQAFRTAAVVMIMLFHAINNFTLFIGMFPLIGIATCIGILPVQAMNRLEKVVVRFGRPLSAYVGRLAARLEKLIRWKQPVYEYSLITERVKIAALVFLTVFVFDWNFSNLSFIKSKMPESLRFIGYSLRLDQNWGMFAPGVFKDDGWYILEGITEKDTVNLLSPEAKLHYNKPGDIVAMFPNDRWRKYTENLIFSNQSFLRGYYCNYSKRVWNENHVAQQLKGLQIVYMSEFTLPDYEYKNPEKITLWECH